MNLEIISETDEKEKITDARIRQETCVHSKFPRMWCEEYKRFLMLAYCRYCKDYKAK